MCHLKAHTLIKDIIIYASAPAQIFLYGFIPYDMAEGMKGFPCHALTLKPAASNCGSGLKTKRRSRAPRHSGGLT